MKQIDYKEYLDRIHGCWMGKCIGGTIGAPYEGAKELFHFEYSAEMIRNMIPNDDLDLQVLWLSVLEEKGIHFTSGDLADAFLKKCPYAPGEYAIFKKNYARGIHPPLCGSYNNRYYLEGMGCPIRSEIWACIAPGNPVLASDLARKDGILDHEGNSVFAEQFLAGLESAAFFESDIMELVETGLSQVPEESKFAGLVRDVRDWCTKEGDWQSVRGRIIRDYGHPDCTNMFQNMGFTLMALLLGKKDFIQTIMMALNSGFDTDCTCATSGAILGIMHGAEFLMEKYGFEDQKYILGVDIKRRSDRIYDLAEDTSHMGLYFAQNSNIELEINGAPKPPEITAPLSLPVSISVDYKGIPAIGIGDRKLLNIHFQNHTSKKISGTAKIRIPQDWIIEKENHKLEISPGETKTWEIAVSVPKDIKILHETNLLSISFHSDEIEEIAYKFGLVGASVWKIFGPFWENCISIPDLKPGESYYSHIPGKDRDDSADNIRAYHLNTKADPDKEYMQLDEISGKSLSGDPCKQGWMKNFYEDLISMEDAAGFQGPCAIYMMRRMISPEDRKCGLLIGHTDGFRLWINGRLVAKRDSREWWTAENVHVHDVEINQGENIIVAELIRRGEDAKWSLVFTKGGACTEHYMDFASLNPEL